MSTWYDPGKVGAKRKALEEQAAALADPAGTGEQDAAPVATPKGDKISSQNSSGKNLLGKQNNSEKDQKKEAPRDQRRRMQFLQYMRQENTQDRELLEEFMDQFDTPKDWEREEHLKDLRPSVWFRKNDYVIEVYATLGCIAAIFGNMPPVADGKREKQDYTMMNIIFPPVKIPHLTEDEDTGEEVEDYEEAKSTLGSFIEECADYILEQQSAVEKQKGEKSTKAFPSNSGEDDK